MENVGYHYRLYQQQYRHMTNHLKIFVHGKLALIIILLNLALPYQVFTSLSTTTQNYLFRLTMKLLNNTKARIGASNIYTYPLYAVVTDDCSKMYNITSITLDDVRRAIDSLYTSTAIRLKLEELPVIIDHFSSYDDIAKSHPELLI